MATFTSDFYADIQASRGEYIVKDYSEQVAQRAREQQLAKSKGEGSRGGKVIGHTKSGKPIYASGGDHKGFSQADHFDAAQAHHAAAANEEGMVDGRGPGSDMAEDAADQHRATAREHLAQGHGMDGDAKPHKIGSGKGAFGPAGNPGSFSRKDHLDAAAAHHAAADEEENGIDGRGVGSDVAADKADAHRAKARDHIKQANDMEDDTVQKNAGAHGEGSRGGKIIGHTRSGKPIYSSSTPMNLRGGKHIYSKVLAAHAPLGYSIHDHADAAKLHEQNYAKTGGMRHHDASIYHSGAAAAKLRGEGSTFDERHGKTSTNIGWTSSKKAIFGHDHEANTARSGVLGGHVKHGYGSIEHSEASQAHIRAAAKVGRRDGKVAARHLKLAAAHADAAKIYDDPSSPRGPSGLPKI